MSESRVKISEKIAEKKRKMFEVIVKQLCNSSLMVILFGSRAKGLETLLSDYDLLVVERDSVEEAPVIQWPAQIFKYGLDSVREGIRSLNTIILDDLIDGKVLCGDADLFQQLRRQAEETVKMRRIVRRGLGWVPEQP
ncbi:MAG: nucleotidyltransferase domain-containing protein [Candidatus Caldarchaeum sp.]